METIKIFTVCLPSLLCGLEGGHYKVNQILSAGRRTGHHATYGVIQWHHHCIPHPGVPVPDMIQRFGPRMPRSPKVYRKSFGSEQQILNLQNLAIDLHTEFRWPEFAMPRKVGDALRTFLRTQRGR